MDLTNEDVADVLALLDSLPYDSLDLETSRFRLTLRRAPGGGWTEESQVLAEPDGACAVSDRGSGGQRAARAPRLAPAARAPAARDAAARPPATPTGLPR